MMRRILLDRRGWLITATGIVIALFLITRATDVDTHNRHVQQLLLLKELDTRLDRDVFRVKAFLLVEYDPLIDTVAEIRSATKDILQPEKGMYGSTQTSVDRRLEAFVGVLREKLVILEDIKLAAALVRNGLYYLPGLTAEAWQAVQQDTTDDQPIARTIADLVNGYLTYSAFTNDSNRTSLDKLIDRLKRGAPSPAMRRIRDNFLIHLETGITSLERLDRLQRQYLAVPSRSAFDALNTAYMDYHDRADRRAEQFSILLLLLSVLLLASVGRMMQKLDRARSTLEASWKRLKDAVESLSEGFALFDSEGRLLLHNQKWLVLYPWQRAIIQPGTTLDELHALDADNLEYLPVVQDHHAPDAGQQRRYEHLHDSRWYLAIDSTTSEGGTASVRVDITDAKRAESEMHKLSLALEQSPASVLITDRFGQIEYVNPKFEEVTGYTREEALGRNPRMLKSGDKSRNDYRELWDTILAGREWRGHFHNRRKDGTAYWESASISPLRDAAGRITHFIAIKEDITARIDAEEQLRLNATVFETTNEGIMVTDAQNRIVAVNPSFERITGYSANEVLGETPGFLKSGRHDAAFYATLWDTLSRKGVWTGEIWNRRKDGNIYPEWLSISLLKDDNGRIKEHVAVFSDITRRKQDEAQIRFQAEYDALTGLPNRVLLLDRLKQSIYIAKRQQRGLALMFLDLDLFKVVNDSMGHLVGDELLQKVAARLLENVRESDTVARFGGDEFVLLLQQVSDGDDIAGIAHKVIKDICRPFHIADREVSVGASIGISLYPNDTEEAEKMLQYADMAMYRAKEAGRNNFQFFTAAMQDQVRGNMELEQDLRLALESDALELYFQPVIDARTNRPVYAEALLRWSHPRLGPVPPSRFIPLAEESGLIGNLGLWVLHRACRQIAKWRAAGLLDKVSVNVSSRQYTLGLEPEQVAAVLASLGLDGSALILEITESLMLKQTDAVVAWMQDLHRLDIELAMDDFGTGYSSLAYLKRFPIDIIKIDRSFVEDLDHDAGDQLLVKAILAMAQSLGLDAVAEGVETDEQRRFLDAHGCDAFQGFHFSRPLPPDECEAWLENHARATLFGARDSA